MGVMVVSHRGFSFISYSLMTNDAQHLLICLLAVYMLSLEKCIFKTFAHLKIDLFALLFQIKSSLFWILYNLIMPYQIYNLYFLPFLWEKSLLDCIT